VVLQVSARIRGKCLHSTYDMEEYIRESSHLLYRSVQRGSHFWTSSVLEKLLGMLVSFVSSKHGG